LTGCYRWAITAAPCEGVVAAAERVVVGQVNLAIRSARPVLTPRDRVGGWELRLEPQTLRDALWVQFQSAIAGGKDYRTCPGCGNWFEVSATEDGRTTRRQYCHSRCKVRHFRSRQARALALKAEGYSAKQIAEQLGATVTTVRVWLGEKAN
ncbi:MAG: sigma factor-like helix-turn-helix DNA-binding protein, partial [Gemmataceae bacterium]